MINWQGKNCSMLSPQVLYMAESSSGILHANSLSHYWECRQHPNLLRMAVWYSTFIFKRNAKWNSQFFLDDALIDSVLTKLDFFYLSSILNGSNNNLLNLSIWAVLHFILTRHDLSPWYNIKYMDPKQGQLKLDSFLHKFDSTKPQWQIQDRVL